MNGPHTWESIQLNRNHTVGNTGPYEISRSSYISLSRSVMALNECRLFCNNFTSKESLGALFCSAANINLWIIQIKVNWSWSFEEGIH